MTQPISSGSAPNPSLRHIAVRIPRTPRIPWDRGNPGSPRPSLGKGHFGVFELVKVLNKVDLELCLDTGVIQSSCCYINRATIWATVRRSILLSQAMCLCVQSHQD